MFSPVSISGSQAYLRLSFAIFFADDSSEKLISKLNRKGGIMKEKIASIGSIITGFLASIC